MYMYYSVAGLNSHIFEAYLKKRVKRMGDQTPDLNPKRRSPNSAADDDDELLMHTPSPAEKAAAKRASEVRAPTIIRDNQRNLLQEEDLIDLTDPVRPQVPEDDTKIVHIRNENPLNKKNAK